MQITKVLVEPRRSRLTACGGCVGHCWPPTGLFFLRLGLLDGYSKLTAFVGTGVFIRTVMVAGFTIAKLWYILIISIQIWRGNKSLLIGTVFFLRQSFRLQLIFFLFFPQHMHKITNLWKFWLTWSSKLQENNERTKCVCFQMLN